MLFDWINFAEGDAFLQKIVSVSSRLGINPDALMGCIWIECEFDRDIVNKDSGAIGLIQFLPSTLKEMGLTVEDIQKMTATEQLEKAVYPYLRKYKSRLKRNIDVYLAIFYPAAMGKPDSFVIGRAGSNTYNWNKGYDLNYGDKDGILEVFDVRAGANGRMVNAIMAHRKNVSYKAKIPNNLNLNIF